MEKETESNQEIIEAVEKFKTVFQQHLSLTVARDWQTSSNLDRFRALAFTVRDKLIKKWLQTQQTYKKNQPKHIYYFSLEFLMGRSLGNALINLEIDKIVDQALSELGSSLEELTEIEADAGLGNGGLGRLAACFLDSMATLELPATGYGIRYEFGMFKQTIENMQQKENPDNWLRYGNPWEIARTENEYKVHFMGNITNYTDHNGAAHSQWTNTDSVIAIGFDIPVPGYQNNTVNTLKLWSATSSNEFKLETFNSGDYIGAMIDKSQSESISKILYPNDNNYKGKELRIKQQYFMVSASLQDILQKHAKKNSIEALPDKVVIQLNDTHPAIAIVELMRILLDQHHLSWEKSWTITNRVFAYTNHTVLPEALEKWPISMMQAVLPRHVEIIYKINQDLLDHVAVVFPGDFERRNRMSIIENSDPQNIRMSNLAIAGSFSVNGVAAIHSELLKTGIFKDFYELYPHKFNNKTNGITPRRWLKRANPPLSDLISSKIGNSWIKNLPDLKALEEHCEDETFLADWAAVKHQNKKILGHLINDCCDIQINPDSIFDIQVKRIHEYKRQLLNILHVIYLYNQIKDQIITDFHPRTIIFGGKAAPGYTMAKDIIHLINAVAKIINNDPGIQDKLKIVFMPNYSVPIAMKIVPAADLSEQISTAGMEASGTGNMKFSLNGALTIGTLDGANIEIMEEVGQENIFIFGHTIEEITSIKQNGYNPHQYLEQDDDLKRILEQIRTGYFSPDNASLFSGIADLLINGGDHFFILADFRKYIECQKRVTLLYQDSRLWNHKSVLNVARMGKFSSDRVIKEYVNDIWHIDPCPII